MLFVDFNLPSLFTVGISHAKRNVSKKAYDDLRIVLVEILSDVCSLDDNGEEEFVVLSLIKKIY